MDEVSERRSTSRRGFLLGSAAVFAASGTGALIGVLTTSQRHRAAGPAPPADLVAAVAQEHALLATLDGLPAGAVAPQIRRELRADHVAHLRALRGALADAVYPSPVPPERSTSLARPSGATSRAKLRSTERAAAGSAARRAGRLRGSDAALLASIAACESGHAELLRRRARRIR
jgi:hypothetical protein